MLLSEDERAPVKAIDFGLAIPFERDDLPLTDLGLEGGLQLTVVVEVLVLFNCCRAQCCLYYF
jgi:hypothetical protein